MEAELKLLRNEREQFVEMGVRLEIQTKELGMIMRDQKEITKVSKKKSPRGWNSSTKVDNNTNKKTGQTIKGIKSFLKNTFTGGNKSKKEQPKKPVISHKPSASLNKTTIAQPLGKI